MAEIYSENLVIKLNEIAQEYRAKMESAIKVVLSQSRYTNTGKGLRSLSVKVTPGTRESSPSIVVNVDDYIVLLNKSKMQWTKLPNTGNLIAWAKTKKSTETEIKKLAFAVAYVKKTTDNHKPKKWRKKGIGETLKDMNVEMTKAFDDAEQKDLEQAVKI